MPKPITSKILGWIEQAQIKTSKGNVFNFRQRPFLLDPITDWHPNQGHDKCSQIGYTESVGVLKSLYLAIIEGLNIMYTMPTDGKAEKMVQTKYDPILSGNPLVFGKVSGGSRVKEIPFGKFKRFIHFVGAYNPMGASTKETTSKGVSDTIDLLIHDEASRSDDTVLQQMRSRLDDSDYRFRWLFDNPTYPNQGADAIYQKSDKRHWFVTCSHCGHRQYLDWIRLDQTDLRGAQLHCYVDHVRKQLVCSKCDEVLTASEILNGEWVAKRPSITEARGYWLSQLIYPKKTIAEILSQDDDPKYPKSDFSNFVMGKPYVGSDVAVTRSQIIQNLDGSINEKKDNFMGVDQGRILWYVIGNEQGIFKVGSTTSWEEIALLRRNYNAIMVCDNMPYPQPLKNLQARYPGKIFRATYAKAREGKAHAIAEFSKDTVLIRRTEAIDEIVDRIQTSRFPIQVPESELTDFSKHWESQRRVIERDAQGNDVPSWIEVDDDHLSHSSIYWYVAMLKGARGHVTIAPLARKG